ncbi:uncharacterized protein LOC118182499 isoform X2 [Stegodyphus dumicola]|nr:uncharacterized protein LOC118182499 isoform X2 [Stegodyphus dumicola]
MPREVVKDAMEQNDFSGLGCFDTAINEMITALPSFDIYDGNYGNVNVTTSNKENENTDMEMTDENYSHDCRCETNAKELSEENNENIDDETWRKQTLGAGSQNITPPSNKKPLKDFCLSWRNRKDLKIRYTRRYLLERQSDPLSMIFPKCLLKFLNTGEIPLRVPEFMTVSSSNGTIPKITNECRNMDHILFYTSLPYTRMRPLCSNIRRKPFKLCY